MEGSAFLLNWAGNVVSEGWIEVKESLTLNILRSYVTEVWTNPCRRKAVTSRKVCS